MKETIMPFNWKAELDNVAVNKVYSIGNDFILFDSFVLDSAPEYPYKINISVVILCRKGYMKGSVNLEKFVAQAPCIVVLNRGQILQHEYTSEDFSGMFLIMSEQFINHLMENMHKRASLQLAFAGNPYMPLNESDLESVTDYYNMLEKTKNIDDLSIRKEMVKHLTLAFLSLLTYRSNILASYMQQSKKSVLVNKFLNLVQENFREQREVGFYADRLCLTPKYLSKVIKDNSGYFASEWIGNRVILEAKALVKSTSMTIRQISDELNFPSQSFFGKYFKRRMGVSPGEYRK
ncbi:MAG: helix-turn-helix domain-containing protein [Tannerellaceae bacterium]|nr:helix-turn-helix domain-containing protein [Tannerellaceae bacterium]